MYIRFIRNMDAVTLGGMQDTTGRFGLVLIPTPLMVAEIADGRPDMLMCVNGEHEVMRAGIRAWVGGISGRWAGVLTLPEGFRQHTNQGIRQVLIRLLSWALPTPAGQLIGFIGKAPGFGLLKAAARMLLPIVK